MKSNSVKSENIVEELIEATALERRRLEDPKNRTRYFMYGKVDEDFGEDSYFAVFEHVPARVLREAKWAMKDSRPSLFRVGERFVEGFLEPAEVRSPGRAKGVRVTIPKEGMNRVGISPRLILPLTDVGMQFVMDSRGLVDQLLSFLTARKGDRNIFLESLTGPAPTPTCRIGGRGAPGAGGAPCPSRLNSSQREALAKALSQKVTFVWGPPGTGKTQTLGALAASLVKRDKKVLLTAVSNNALDQLLSAAIERLGFSYDCPDEFSESGRSQGSWHLGRQRHWSVARLGSVISEDLKVFGRGAFYEGRFAGAPAGKRWGAHVEECGLVAANLAILCYPGGASPGLCDYVIADEVSMANVPSLAAATYFAREGVVLGGDPFQLPPIYPEDAEHPNAWFHENVFQTAGVKSRDDERAAFLDTQYRMQGEIAELVSAMFYDGCLKTGVEAGPGRRGGLGGFRSRAVFVNSPGSVGRSRHGSFDIEGHRRYNSAHAEAAAGMARAFLEGGADAGVIGVIAPYNAQVVEILARLGGDAAGIKVSTVHAFQGQERRGIIFDITDDGVAPTPLTASRRLINVALSRAREQVVIIGNRDYITSSKFFSRSERALFAKMLECCEVV